jgi:hypothetical protein
MKRLKIGFLIVVFATLVVIGGCSQLLFGSPLGFIDFWRGPEAYRVDYVEVVNAAGGFPRLRLECQAMAERFDRTDSYQISLSNLPPTLAALKPQFVSPYGHDVFIDIQTSGGFYHRGLLVSLTEPNRVAPQKKWLRDEIAPGVFEYRE